jgi:hypothetical protein
LVKSKFSLKYYSLALRAVSFKKEWEIKARKLASPIKINIVR